MFFSGTAIHGVYALCYLDRQQRGTATSASDVASAGGIPKDYASKALKGLVNAGLVDSIIGRGGGYALVKELQDIFLVTVFDALNPSEDDGRLRPRSCKGEPSRMCMAHRGLLQLNAQVRRVISNETLAALAGAVCRNKGAPTIINSYCKPKRENHYVTFS